MTQLKDIIPEIIVSFFILIIVGYIVWAPEKDDTSQVEIPSMENFYDHPLITWPGYDINGYPCIKVKYLVNRKNTRLYMLDEKGHMVHKTPLSFSPLPDGRERIETYVWKLHRTEWTPEIFPGTYTIVVGTDYDRRGLTEEVIIE